MAFPKFVSFWVEFLAFLWPKVTNNHGVPEIRVFLWPKVTNNYGVPKICVFLHPEMLKFCVVGELSCWGHKLEIDVLNFNPFCYWKGAKFVQKIYIFWAILMCIVDALSQSFHAGGRSESALVISFYVGVMICKRSYG